VDDPRPWWKPSTIETEQIYDVPGLWAIRMDHEDTPQILGMVVSMADPQPEVCGATLSEMYHRCILPPDHETPHVPFTRELLWTCKGLKVDRITIWPSIEAVLSSA
jgi:hypothetical protein